MVCLTTHTIREGKKGRVSEQTNKMRTKPVPQPLPRTTNGNVYCIVMVEYYSKHIEVVAVPNKEPPTIARTFLDRVISQFGCCAEVISDNGGEFTKEFSDLLAQLCIDHRNVSANHPQANGLAERTV